MIGRAPTIRVSLALVSLAVGSLGAQPITRRAVSLASLVAYPGFYHQRPIVTVGDLALSDAGQVRMSHDGWSLFVVAKDGAPDGPSEVRGEFWDLGRMNADDPRLSQFDLDRTFQIDPNGTWPLPGQVLAVVAADIAPAVAPLDASIRGLVLFPSRYLDQRVVLTGQFAGNNLLGDLPDSPANSRWDFVVRSADAAIWVSNIQPRGRDFELSLDARVDTGRWVQVAGVLRQGRGLQWIDGEADSLRLAEAPAETPARAPVEISMSPPPEVIFSAPTGGETEVESATTVRIQFSRDIEAATFEGRVRVSYGDGDGTAVGEFTTQYRPGNRVLEIEFARPLEPLRLVTVELTEGILGTDKQPLVPWSLEFETGG